VRRRRGDDFFDNFDRALEPARTGQVDVVVHGGDLLYRSRVSASLVEAALAPLKRLAAAGIPVLLVPGNHERSRMPYPLLAFEEGLHVFDRPRTVMLDAGGIRAAFIGFPYTSNIRHRFRDLLRLSVQDAPAGDIRVLCVHQCIEGATCGPGNFTFRSGTDVIRTADLPADLAVTLSGHIHRHQVLRPPAGGPVIYAGSIERTSFAEASETKGFVVLELTPSGLGGFEFKALPARPMVTRTLVFDTGTNAPGLDEVSAAIDATPGDAVVRLRVVGRLPPFLTAATLRSIAGARNVTLSPAASVRHSRGA
jgi:DNA repair exonuclease SbcCD nuclease subunit